MYRRLGRTAEQAASLERAVSLDPALLEARHNLMLLRHNQPFREEDVLRAANALVAADPRRFLHDASVAGAITGVSHVLADALLSRGRPHHARAPGRAAEVLRALSLSERLRYARVLFLMMPGASRADRRAAARALRAAEDGIRAAPEPFAAWMGFASQWIQTACACGPLGAVLRDKVLLHRAMQRAGRGALAPETYDLTDADDLARFDVARRADARRADAGSAPALWLLRLAGSGDGRGTRVLGAREPVPRDGLTRALVSRYVADPLLVDGRKTEIRAYALVESAWPDLRVHVYRRWYYVRRSALRHARVASGPAEGEDASPDLEGRIFNNVNRNKRVLAARRPGDPPPELVEVIDPARIVAAAEARSGRPWAETREAIEEAVADVVDAAWRAARAMAGERAAPAGERAERAISRSAPPAGEGGGDRGGRPAAELSCANALVAVDVLLDGPTLAPVVLEASTSHGNPMWGTTALPEDLLAWLTRRAESLAEDPEARAGAFANFWPRVRGSSPRRAAGSGTCGERGAC
jgi:hypothetical protein